MATYTIKGGTTFAEGVSVGAYPATQVGPEGGPPSGSATDTKTVTNGDLVFTGLADNKEYVAYAASPNRYKRFRTDPASAATTSSSGGGGIYYRGAWAATTAYKAGEVVSQAGALYAALADFTSGASFNTANWRALTLPLAPGTVWTGATDPGAFAHDGDAWVNTT